MAEAYAYTTGANSTKLFVQTYDSNFQPLRLVPVDTVKGSDTTFPAQIADVSVISNQDGSFAVFWTDANSPVEFKSFSYEQSFAANGTARAKHTLVQGTVSPLNANNAGDLNSNGGMAYAFSTVTPSPTARSTILSVQTYDFKFTPLQLVHVDTVSDSGSEGSNSTAVLSQIANVSVTSNPDGSFAVFWTDDSDTLVFGSNAQLLSDSFKYISYEQSFAANGTVGAKNILTQGTTPSPLRAVSPTLVDMTDEPDPPNPTNAGDVNSKGGMAYAFSTVTGLSDKLSVQTYIPIFFRFNWSPSTPSTALRAPITLPSLRKLPTYLSPLIRTVPSRCSGPTITIRRSLGPLLLTALNTSAMSKASPPTARRERNIF